MPIEPTAIVEGTYEPPEQIREQEQETGDTTQSPNAGLGPWLEDDELEVVKLIHRAWTRQEQAMDRRKSRWKAYRLWRQGKRFVRLVEETHQLRVYVPPSTGYEPPAPNKAATLLRRMVATLMVDPPVPECEPGGDTDEARDASEFSTRALKAETDALDYVQRHEQAVDKSSTFSSAFMYFCVDPHGGGQEPMEVKAHPLATEWTGDAEAVTQSPDPMQQGAVELVTKYVMPDNTLGDSPLQAQTRWLPKIRMETLTGHHVRFLPEHSTGIEEADGVIACIPTTLGQLRAQCEGEDKPWSDDVLREVVTYRPQKWRDLLPAFLHAESVEDKTGWKDGVPPDDAVCFPYVAYRRESAAYREGAYLITIGDKRLLHRQPWSAVTVGQEGMERKEVLMLPFSQVRQLDDHQDGDPYGTCFIETLGLLDEIRAAQVGAALEYLDRFNHPREFIPHGSNLTPAQLRGTRDGTPLIVNMVSGPPIIEQVPPLPPAVVDMLQFISQEMDTEVSLHQTAQGLESKNSQSGIAKQLVIEQANVGLSGVKRNSDAAFERSMRVILQLMRAYYTVQQRLSYVGEDGKYKEKRWTRADLGSTKQVRIQRGTSTMLAPSSKQALAREELEIGLKAQDPNAYPRYVRSVTGNLSTWLGQQDDPIRQRVRQQIAEWEEGPTAEQQQQAEQAQLMAQQQPPQVDPMTGQSVPPPDLLAQLSAQLFAPLPIDEEPLYAMTRREELARAMASVKFAKQPPGWQQGLVAAYQQARMAAGVQTVMEQQQAAQQQQQMQMQAEQQKQAGDQQFKREEREDKQMHDLSVEREKMRAKAVQPAGAVR